jgi:prepilin-type processing-associated H-X9-DG protein
MVCANYVLEIGRALYNYQGVHGTLPPAHLLDKDGKPLHSWRLLLLPHIEESILYGQFDLTQPWNARRNDYWRQPVCLYQCPNDGHGMQATTRYLAVVGPDSLWGKRWGITDDAGQADRRTPAVVVEVPDSDVRWAEPRDITLEEACTILASANVSGASGRHSIPGNFFFEEVVGANVLFADGSVMFVPTGWPREMLAGALAGDPAEIAALARFQESAKRRINWPRCASVAGLVLAVAAMMFWPRRAVTRPSEAEPAKAGETCPVRPA